MKSKLTMTIPSNRVDRHHVTFAHIGVARDALGAAEVLLEQCWVTP
jgi:hypothetical protein